MEQLRVLLVVSPGAARDAYLKELAPLSTQHDVVEAIDQIETSLVDTPYNGIVLDVPTAIRANPAQKRKIQALLEFYPVLRISYRADLAVNLGLTDGLTPSRSSTLAEFVRHDCAVFAARPLRFCQRSPLTLNVRLLARPDQPVDSGSKAYTVNLSESGCFVATPEPPPTGQSVFAVFTDLPDHTPIALDVRWRFPWGEAPRVPGFGAAFVHLPTAQKDSLLQLLLKARRYSP